MKVNPVCARRRRKPNQVRFNSFWEVVNKSIHKRKKIIHFNVKLLKRNVFFLGFVFYFVSLV